MADLFTELRPLVEEIVRDWTVPDDEAFWDIGSTMWENGAGQLGVGYFFTVAINSPLGDGELPVATSVLFNDPRSLLDRNFANDVVRDAIASLRKRCADLLSTPPEGGPEEQPTPPLLRVHEHAPQWPPPSVR